MTRNLSSFTNDSTMDEKKLTLTTPIARIGQKRPSFSDVDYSYFVKCERRRLLAADPTLEPSTLAVRIARRYKLLCDQKNRSSFTNYRIGKAEVGVKRCFDENMNSSYGSFGSPDNSENSENSKRRVSQQDYSKSDTVSANIAAALGISMLDCTANTVKEPRILHNSSSNPRIESLGNCKLSRGFISKVTNPSSIQVSKNAIEPPKVDSLPVSNKSNISPVQSSHLVQNVPATVVNTISRKDNLRMFYLACCEPAFPPTCDVPDITPYSANHYYDNYTGVRAKVVQSLL